MARPTMEDMFRVLCRKEPVPTSYFELYATFKRGAPKFEGGRSRGAVRELGRLGQWCKPIILR
jgi:hypothetical protein